MMYAFLGWKVDSAGYEFSVTWGKVKEQKHGKRGTQENSLHFKPSWISVWYFILFFIYITNSVIFRCSLPTAMSISRSEILRRKKERSWKNHGRSSEVISSSEILREKREVISRGEILRGKIRREVEQEHKVSYRCSLPSPLQKRSKDYQGLHKILMNSRCFEESFFS